MRLSSSVLIIAAVASVGACSLFTDSTICTAELRPGIMVDVQDSVTSAPLGAGARVIAIDGAYADTATFPWDGIRRYGVAAERAGIYTVTVEYEGYRLWSRSGVRVRKGECHVRTVDLVARLRP